MTGVQTCALPIFIFYNDSVLSKLDFLGLRQVGRGGKTNEIDTHGRHGRGALAFYYFTDVSSTNFNLTYPS